jgi:hypothetical protein
MDTQSIQMAAGLMNKHPRVLFLLRKKEPPTRVAYHMNKSRTDSFIAKKGANPTAKKAREIPVRKLIIGFKWVIPFGKCIVINITSSKQRCQIIIF